MDNLIEKIEKTEPTISEHEPDVIESLLSNYEHGVFDRETFKQKLGNLIDRDSLTGLLNRGGIEKVLHREMRIYERRTFQGELAKPLSVLLLDGDGLKRINDTLGHTVGDIAISKIVEAIEVSASRPSDSAGRRGGDEFLVVLPETNIEGALLVAEEIRRRVAANQFPRLSISIGVALYSGRTTIAQLIDNADKAMYRAKEGRNAIAIHLEDLPQDPAELLRLTSLIEEKGIQVATQKQDILKAYTSTKTG